MSWWGFHLLPRGVPQVEVTFDIDANGIVHVAAKDLGTGKEQSIKITASSGLSEEEIQSMVRDAEAHAEEDKKKRDVVDARNQADSLVYMTEKSLKEHGDKVDAWCEAPSKQPLPKRRRRWKARTRKKSSGPWKSCNRPPISSRKPCMQQAAGAGGAGPEAGSAGAGPGRAGGPQASAKPEEDVVDAEYEEVKEERSK